MISLDSRQTRRLVAAIVVLDLILTLTPPVYWIAGRGSAVWSLTYFVGGGLVVTASIYVLYYLDSVRIAPVSADEEAKGQILP